MAARRAPDGARGPLLIAAACALATLFFFAIRFPYDLFRDVMAVQLGALTGAEVELGEVRGGPGLAGLTLRAAPLALRWPGGGRLELTRASLRPAWSLSWLRGRPALHLDLDAPSGRVTGTVWPGPPLALSGTVRGLALEALPPEVLAAAQGFALTGRLDADADLSSGDGALGGAVELDVRDGAASAPGSPISVPFERLTAALALDASGALRVESAVLEGPMVAGSAQGQLGPAPDPSQAPLDLRIDLRVADPSLRSMLAPLGVQLDREGKATLQLEGTLGAPVLR
jgi:type II secretion system protein N